MTRITGTLHEDQLTCLSYLNQFFSEGETFQTKFVEEIQTHILFVFFSEVCHPRCVWNKSNYNAYACIVKHNYISGGMLFAICEAQLHVSAINFGHLRVVQ
jgi:hypothetical protein